MAKLFGREYTKREILERVGNISQIATIKRYKIEDGRGSSLLAVDMKNGSGLDITVLPGRGMDILHASFKGIPIAWISKCGVSSPSYFEPEGLGWLRNFAGGLLTTCGLTYSGAPCTDGDELLGLHGRISNIPADEVLSYGEWDLDDYYLYASGKVTEARVFGENICLSRKISMKMGDNCIYIDDDIENLGFKPEPFMIIYHMNIGFPLLGTETKLHVDSLSTIGATDLASENVDKCCNMTAPMPEFKEQVFYHDCSSDDMGYAKCSITNESVNVGMKLRFNIDELPNFTQWKMMGQGDYVLGLEPCNCRTLGRVYERAQGTLKFIQPGEIKHIHLVLDFFDLH